jgi:hypothetical protein
VLNVENQARRSGRQPSGGGARHRVDDGRAFRHGELLEALKGELEALGLRTDDALEQDEVVRNRPAATGIHGQVSVRASVQMKKAGANPAYVIEIIGGRCWVRTSDPCRVKAVLSR